MPASPMFVVARLLRHVRLAAVWGACLGVVTCGQSPAEPTAASSGTTTAVASASPRSVLFIGNSLTESNALPLMVERLGVADGQPLDIDSVTYGGVSLEDHWGMGTQARISARRWQWVVLQQGPSALPESRDNLREWTARFERPIREAGATPALYMVWPSRERSSDFDRVSESYRLAASDVGGIVLPAGDAWRAAWRRSPNLALYGSDNFHPSRAGTYLAAITIYAALTGRSPVGLPSRLQLRDGTTIDIPARDVAVMQEAAAEVVGR